jgi:hypothetical protein
MEVPEMLDLEYNLLRLDNEIITLSFESVKGEVWLALSNDLVEEVEKALVESCANEEFRELVVKDLTHLKAQMCRLRSGTED